MTSLSALKQCPANWRRQQIGVSEIEGMLCYMLCPMNVCICSVPSSLGCLCLSPGLCTIEKNWFNYILEDFIIP